MKKLLVLLLLGSSVIVHAQKKDITLEGIFKQGRFAVKSVKGLRSMKDGKTYVSITTDEKTGKSIVAKYNYSDGKMAAILYTEDETNYNGLHLPLSTEFSDDEQKVLLSIDQEAIYRRSSKANNYVLDLKTKKITPVSSKGKQLHASFSPDGSKVAFVRDNNIYITNLNTLEEKQITNDGKFNSIINGNCDWVYEEEFEFTKAFFWSPDNKKIAYYRFDESAVPEFSMTMFENLYPKDYTYKYPKAGEKNSVVGINIYNLDNNNTSKVAVGDDTEQYIPRIQWTQSAEKLCVLRMNRHQNKLEYLLADATSGATKVLHTETDKAYVEVNNNLIFLKNGKQFLITSEKDGYNHIYLYDMNDKLVSQVTEGKWEVVSFYGVDEKNGTVYYQSTERSPLRRDVYAVDLNGKNKKRISTQDGTNTATFNADFSYYILSNVSSASPAYITLNNKQGKVIRILEDNAAAKAVFAQYKVAPVEFFDFKTAQGTNLNGYMIKPDNFDPNKKYPVLLYVYGGPGSQNVADTWYNARTLWFKYLANQGMIVACVDNRGTGFRGADFKKNTYLQLGKNETEDQIETAKWFARQSYVDGKRIGIWGWSYGGYMSSLCITKGADVFKMAIAVAPVTNWRFYDSIYTERYMRTPQENAAGYDDNSPINHTDKLKGKYLLVHGTADDNVHFQNAVMLSESLIQANKPFEQAYYPNKNHGIYGGNTSLHLYTKLTDFIIKNL